VILRIFAGHLSLVCAMAWFPLELLMLELGLRKGRVGYYLLCGVVFAAQITAGYPQLVLYSGIMAALYIICRLLFLMGEGRGREVGIALVGAVVLCAVAVGLSSVQLLPSLEFTALRKTLPRFWFPNCSETSSLRIAGGGRSFGRHRLTWVFSLLLSPCLRCFTGETDIRPFLQCWVPPPSSLRWAVTRRF
jgi:hypothetical protein